MFLLSRFSLEEDIVQYNIIIHLINQFDPCSRSCKRWKLSAAKSSAVANALSFPPGEYARKSETQRN
jgi:hypothetical protein